jgi:hypothetical protein
MGLTGLLSSHSSLLLLEHCRRWRRTQQSSKSRRMWRVGSAAASPVGTRVTFPVTSTLSVETDVAIVRGEGDIHALSSSASLVYSLPRVGQSTPYVAGGWAIAIRGAGFLLQRSADRHRAARGLTVNAGGGLKMP